MSYRFKPEKLDVEYPPRIKKIADEYSRHGFEWHPDPDEDMETFKEWSFEGYATKRPETVRQEVMAVYRLRDEFTLDEWMLWKIRKIVTATQNNKDIDYVAEIWMGKLPRFDTREITDDAGNIVNKVITVWNMVYTDKWDPKQYDEIMKDSKKKNIPCYIAYTSDQFKQNHSGTPIMIKDMKVFRDYTYDQLVEYDHAIERKRKAAESESKILKAK